MKTTITLRCHIYLSYSKAFFETCNLMKNITSFTNPLLIYFHPWVLYVCTVVTGGGGYGCTTCEAGLTGDGHTCTDTDEVRVSLLLDYILNVNHA